jgi:RNase P protein component
MGVFKLVSHIKRRTWAKKSENAVRRQLFERNIWEIFRRLEKIVLGGALLRGLLTKYW